LVGIIQTIVQPKPTTHKKTPCKTLNLQGVFLKTVARLGLEPRLTEPKSAVLPLDDRALFSGRKDNQILKWQNFFQKLKPSFFNAHMTITKRGF